MTQLDYDAMRTMARELYVPGEFGYGRIVKRLEQAFPGWAGEKHTVGRWVNEEKRLRVQKQKEASRKRDRHSTDPVRRAHSMRARVSGRKGYALDLEWFQTRLGAGVCEATGVPFDLTELKSPWSPEVDQIVADGGYSKENTQMVCRMYNMAKETNTHEDVLLLAKALVHKG